MTTFPVANEEHAFKIVFKAFEYTNSPSTYPFTHLAPQGDPVAEPEYVMFGT